MLVWCSRAADLASRQEPLEMAGVEQGVRRQDLERDVAAERLLLGLVDDPHAAAADLAEDAEVAEPLGNAARLGSAVRRGSYP